MNDHEHDQYPRGVHRGARLGQRQADKHSGYGQDMRDGADGPVRPVENGAVLILGMAATEGDQRLEKKNGDIVGKTLFQIILPGQSSKTLSSWITFQMTFPDEF